MRLHQIAQQSNNCFAPGQYLDDISNNLESNILISSESKNQNNKSINNDKIPGLPLYDRLGCLKPLALTYANICILGDNLSYLLDLALHTQKYFAGIGRLVKLINIRQYYKLSSCERNNDHLIYAVIGSSTDVSLADLIPLLKQFTNIFVFPLEGISLACSYAGLIRTSPHANKISHALGENHHLRKYLLSTLKDDEFLAITGERETIRTLNQKICYSKGGTGNGLSAN